MIQIYIAIQIVVISLILFALGILLQGDGSKEQKMMSYFLWGTLIHNAGYLLELLAQSKEAALTATKMQYVGSVFIPLCYCWFIFAYCNIKAPKPILDLLNVLDLFVLVCVFTCDKHTWYYKQIGWVTDSAEHPYLDLSYGPVYIVFLLTGCILPYLISLYPLIYTIVKRSKQMPGREYKVFAILSCFPVLALAAYAFQINVAFDTTPAVLGVMLAMVVVLVWSRRNFDFSRMAAGVVLDNMEDGVILLDENKKIASFNRAATEIFTELSFQIVGDSIEDVEDFPDNMLEGEDNREEFILNKKFYECHMRRVDGKNKDSRGYVILILDVTATRKYITEIESLRVEAERANVAKSEFLANMSHEIRTPMNAIVGLSDIIMEESRGRKVYGYACDIKSASQNLLTIINDILDLSKVEAGKMELVPVDYYIKGIVGDVVNMMDIAASQRGLLLQCEYDMKIPCQYHGDDGRIKQILINITNNAVKFTKEGHVKISVGGQPGTEPGTELLIFRIEDTGCGIAPENLDKIFEDFKQVDSKKNRGVEGTGLGLSITRRLTQLMKGTIEVESVYGEGTTFIIKIPQEIVNTKTLEEVPEVPTKENVVVDDFVVDNYKVMVVDDNLINRKVAMGFLKNYGFELTEADSGPRAIELVKEKMFGLIFMDHMMPGMDGVEAVKIIREECGANGRTPIIIALTANAMEGVREKFLQCGFQDFLPKPLDRKSLNDMLDKWIPDNYKILKNPSGTNSDDEELKFEDIRIAGIEIEEAMKHHTGDVADFLELLKLYCMDGKRKCLLLRELLEAKDYVNYGIEVHGLKSASANVGAMELSKQAREHEDAVKRQDDNFVQYHFSDLISCYENQLSEIDKFMQNQQDRKDSSGQGKKKTISKAQLMNGITQALEKVEDFRSKECAQIIDELLGCQLIPDAEERLVEIREQLRMYEDDEAEKLLRQMIDWLNKEVY